YQTNAGAIFQPGAMRPLFEDRRARMIGDTLVINLSERTQAAKKASSSADRSQEITTGVPKIAGLPFKSAQGIDISAKGENVFAGKGASS
ncbi:flagellar basal body L-ring protein FlgH, partial [Acinetobacter baumannii]